MKELRMIFKKFKSSDASHVAMRTYRSVGVADKQMLTNLMTRTVAEQSMKIVKNVVF